jgi:hypothetical protein
MIRNVHISGMNQDCPPWSSRIPHDTHATTIAALALLDQIVLALLLQHRKGVTTCPQRGGHQPLLARTSFPTRILKVAASPTLETSLPPWLAIAPPNAATLHCFPRSTPLHLPDPRRALESASRTLRHRLLSTCAAQLMSTSAHRSLSGSTAFTCRRQWPVVASTAGVGGGSNPG